MARKDFPDSTGAPDNTEHRERTALPAHRGLRALQVPLALQVMTP